MDPLAALSHPDDDPTPPDRPGWALLKRAAIGAVLIVSLSAATVASAVLLEVKELTRIIRNESVPLAPAVSSLLENVASGKPQTILVIGDDRRKADAEQGNPTRSDTMILVRLDPKKGATAMMSLPRDLLVDIPGYGRDKLNAAFALGEDHLTLRTIRGLLDIPIHHYVRVTFWGFREAVDRVGCVYVDVDRKYFNDNHPPNGGGGPYAVIDVPAGYQRLCGQKALDYVRYRHLDNDLVRAARQQSFLGEAKGQVGVAGVFSDRAQLLRIFARSVRTDIRSTRAVLSLLKLVAESSGKPVQEVQFPAQDIGDGTGNVAISDTALRRTVRRFLDVRGTRGARGRTARTKTKRRADRRSSRRRHRGAATVAPGLVANRKAGEDEAARVQVKLSRLPVYYPALMATGGRYRSDHARAYDIADRSGRRHRAYRIVAFQGSIGQYYGIQGTTWKSPPILDDPSERRRERGRTYELFYDGGRLRIVAWRTSRGVYWISNTLLRTLTNRQMLALARSARRVAG
ncbi:MAG TPA: LCP family protein [Solirubrobacteraceae bacterium]|nr:LCP family protein [Solirubrobacteraceae bacterium]